MIWTDDSPLEGETESRGPVDGGTYRALIMREYERGVWLATVDLYLDGYHYVATSRFCVDVVMAKIWTEAALLQLRRVAEQLGEVRS